MSDDKNEIINVLMEDTDCRFIQEYDVREKTFWAALRDPKSGHGYKAKAIEGTCSGGYAYSVRGIRAARAEAMAKGAAL